MINFAYQGQLNSPQEPKVAFDNQNTDTPIFIFGMPRSGTSLLGYILSAHSQIVIAPETHYLSRFVHKQENAKGNQEKLNEITRDYLNSNAIGDLGFDDKEKQQLADIFLDAKNSQREIFKYILQLFAKKYNKTILGEKTPKHIEYVDTLNLWFTNARFITIIRDPRDVSLSLQKVPWDDHSILQHAQRWVKYVHLSENYKKNNEIAPRYLELKYEDLLLSPHEILQQICHHIQLPYEDGMLNYWASHAESIELKRKDWKKKNTRSIDKKNYNKWINQMPLHETRLIEAIAGKEMKDKDYKLSHELRYNSFSYALAGLMAQALLAYLSANKTYRMGQKKIKKFVASHFT